MSIATYAELVSALDGASGYLHRTDLTAKIPDFIKLAEAHINRRLKVLLQETESTLTASVGSRLMAVPTRFGTPVALWLTTYAPRIAMVYRDPTDLPVTTSSSGSDYYTVDGAYIATENPADVAYTYLLRYWTKFNLATTLTNTVLDDNPDVYLYGALLESIGYTQDTTNLQLWTGRYEQGISEALAYNTATRGRVLLRSDRCAPRSNIYRGE